MSKVVESFEAIVKFTPQSTMRMDGDVHTVHTNETLIRPLVRCKDCKYWNECGFGMHDDQCHCSRIDYWTNADFFCAACVRKEDNEDIVFGYDNISDDDDCDDWFDWFGADGEKG